MIISNAMNTTSLVMTRLRDDLAAHRREVEARLSLGQTAAEAAGALAPGRAAHRHAADRRPDQGRRAWWPCPAP